MKKSLLTIFLFSSFYYSNAQNWIWAYDYGEIEPKYEAADKNGNVYIAYDVSISPFGHHDIYINKYNTLGSFEWNVYIHGVNIYNFYEDCQVQDIAIDDDNNVYVLGFGAGTPGISYTYSYGTNGAYSSDEPGWYIIKYNSAGENQWIRRFGDSYEHDEVRMKIDHACNIILSGVMNDFINVYGTDTIHIVAQYAGMFLAKWNSSGNFLWVTSSDSSGACLVRDIEVDEQNNIYTTGWFVGILHCGNIHLTESLFSSDPESNSFIAKFTPSGIPVWMRQSNAVSYTSIQNNAYGLDVGIDSLNNVYEMGQMSMHIVFNNDTLDYTDSSGFNVSGFIVKYDSSGNYIKVSGIESLVGDAAVDKSGNCYVQGFNASFNIYNPLGHRIVNQLITSSYVFTGDTYFLPKIRGIVGPDAAGNVYYVGLYEDDIATFNSIILTNPSSDARLLIAKYGQGIPTTNEPSPTSNTNSISFSIFPNPFQNNINLLSEKPIREIVIRSLSGNMVWRNQYNNQTKNEIISLSLLSPGVYILSLKTDSNVENIKVIKN